MNRQDAKEARYEAPEIRSEFSQTGPVFYLTWRSWRLGGENLFTLPNGVTLAKQGFAVEKQSVAVEGRFENMEKSGIASKASVPTNTI